MKLGLGFGSSQVRRSPELITDPEFDNPAAWTLVQPTLGSVAISGGQCVIDSQDGTFATATAVGVSPVIGRTYEYVIVVSAISGGGVSLVIGGPQHNFTVPGTYTGRILANAAVGVDVKRFGGVPCGGTITSVSVKEIFNGI
jgi:hypothetical protein